jgi:hypothetical protein
MPQNHASRFQPWIILVPILAILLNFVIFPEYTGDDSFIHFTYARNLLERGVLAYNGTSPSYGSTSILWVTLGALASWPTGAVPPSMRVLGALLFAVSILLAVAFIHRRHPLAPASQMVLALFLTASAVLFRWSLTGMETGLVCFVTALLLLFADTGHPLRTASLCLAALLVRPEFLLFPLCYVTVSAIRKPVDRVAILKFAAFVVLFFGAWFAIAQWYFGRAMPMTSIKSVGWMDWPSTVRIIRVGFGAFPGLLLLALAVLWSVRKGGNTELRLSAIEWAFILFAGALILSYIVRGTNLISRYLTVLYIPLGVVCARGIARRWMKDGRLHWKAGVLIAISVSIEAGAFVVVHAPHIRSFVDGFQRTYKSMGECIASRSGGSGGEVMVADVGLIGFYSRRPVIDLAGLTSSHVYDARSHDDTVLVARYHPRFVIIREDSMRIPAYQAMLARQAGGSDAVRKLFTTSIPPLGVMSDPAHWWQVELFEVAYGVGEPASSSVVTESAADPSQRQDR